VVGRNGSGKSTLLKLLAGIYQPDSGGVWVAGRVAPIIDLGVGFHNELTARDNVELNGVMMGLEPRDARSRFEEIIEMAELEDFVDLKLKNFSSGMRMRLAFSVVSHVDADILLLDEVLAVGDESFQRKCEDAFSRLIAAGKTIVLVTHSMIRIERLCDRAMLLEGGRIERIGEPAEVARRYVELNLEHGVAASVPAEELSPAEGGPARIVDLWLEDAGGARVQGVRQRDALSIHPVVEATHELHDPRFRFEIRNYERGRIFASAGEQLGARHRRLIAGEYLHVNAEVDNKLAPGRYTITCAISHAPEGERARASDARTIEVGVVGADKFQGGIVELDHEVKVRPLPRRGARISRLRSARSRRSSTRRSDDGRRPRPSERFPCRPPTGTGPLRRELGLEALRPAHVAVVEDRLQASIRRVAPRRGVVTRQPAVAFRGALSGLQRDP